VIDKKECWHHEVPYNGDTMRVSYVVIKSESAWNFDHTAVGLDLIVEGPAGHQVHTSRTEVEDASKSEEKKAPALVEEATTKSEGFPIVEERAGEAAPVVSRAEDTAVGGEEAAAPDGEGLATPIAEESAVVVEEAVPVAETEEELSTPAGK
jgi:hypothetical protein